MENVKEVKVEAEVKEESAEVLKNKVHEASFNYSELAKAMKGAASHIAKKHGASNANAQNQFANGKSKELSKSTMRLAAAREGYVYLELLIPEEDLTDEVITEFKEFNNSFIKLIEDIKLENQARKEKATLLRKEKEAEAKAIKARKEKEAEAIKARKEEGKEEGKEVKEKEATKSEEVKESLPEPEAVVDLGISLPAADVFAGISLNDDAIVAE